MIHNAEHMEGVGYRRGYAAGHLDGGRELAQLMLTQYYAGREHWTSDEDLAQIADDLLDALKEAAQEDSNG